MRVALNPISRFFVRDKRETDTEDKLHEDKGRDGREGPQAQGPLESKKLEKAGRTPFWSPWKATSS